MKLRGDEAIIRYNIYRCQVVAKFCRDYKSHTVPARSDCIFFITHPEGACGWACTNLPRARAATVYTYIRIAWQSCARCTDYTVPLPARPDRGSLLSTTRCKLRDGARPARVDGRTRAQTCPVRAPPRL